MTRSLAASGWSTRRQATGVPSMSRSATSDGGTSSPGSTLTRPEVERALGEALLDVDLPAVDHLDAARPVAGVQVAQGGGEQARRTRC